MTVSHCKAFAGRDTSERRKHSCRRREQRTKSSISIGCIWKGRAQHCYNISMQQMREPFAGMPVKRAQTIPDADVCLAPSSCVEALRQSPKETGDESAEARMLSAKSWMRSRSGRLSSCSVAPCALMTSRNGRVSHECAQPIVSKEKSSAGR
jgi:hypothetical protein